MQIAIRAGARLGAACACALLFALAQPSPTVADTDAQVLSGTFSSPAVAGQLHYRVYLPAGYLSSTGRYPVIYLLHGLPDQGGGYRTGMIVTVGQAAARAGRPAIVVAPQGARAGDTDPEWHDWGPGRDWETAVARDLVRMVDGRYRTIAARSARALIGISAGGYGAMLIGLHHLDRFSVIEAWSGYFHPTNPSGSAPLDVGSAEANRRASAHTYVVGLSTRLRRLPTYLGFYVGAADPHFVPENRTFDAELSRAGVTHRFAVYQGGHSSALWSDRADDWTGQSVLALSPAA
jgi:enterochelin esterase-like enzyme